MDNMFDSSDQPPPLRKPATVAGRKQSNVWSVFWQYTDSKKANLARYTLISQYDVINM